MRRVRERGHGGRGGGRDGEDFLQRFKSLSSMISESIFGVEEGGGEKIK